MRRRPTGRTPRRCGLGDAIAMGRDRSSGIVETAGQVQDPPESLRESGTQAIDEAGDAPLLVEGCGSQGTVRVADAWTQRNEVQWPALVEVPDRDRGSPLGGERHRTYARPALKERFQAVGMKVTATNEPRRAECGAPDFGVSLRMGHGLGPRVDVVGNANFLASRRIVRPTLRQKQLAIQPAME